MSALRLRRIDMGDLPSFDREQHQLIHTVSIRASRGSLVAGGSSLLESRAPC